MALESYCCSCTYMGENVDSYGKYYCERKGERRYASDAKCYSWCEAYSRSNGSRDNMYNNSKNHQSSGCFLTTIVHKILGKEDNDKVLENFRAFRDNVLQKNKKYYDVLKEYDIIGPMLVDCIENDCDKEKMAGGVYRNILLPLNEKINNKEYAQAVNMYHCMTMTLINYYGLDSEFEEIKANGYNYPSFNPKSAGHGLRKIRVNTDCCIKC